MQVDAIIITAMDDEAQPFLDRATEVGEATRVGHAVYRRVTLAGHPMLVVRSGIGLVNAAGAATSAILATQSDGVEPLVISAGTAGGVGPAVRVGDVVVGSDYVNVDADARVFGYELGQVPKMPARYSALAAHREAADRAVLRVADVSASVHVGLVVSSYSFVTAERAAEIIGQFPGALATDMESVAIAQTCHVYGRPFLSVRGISDLCGPVAGSDFVSHVDDAADRSAIVTIALFDELLQPTAAVDVGSGR
ncbi:5'-methylthioadenosine/S-adenosylhomocysteine nucleosidase [Subtercola endophyticus]|uniref:5'-methylthioadenosine/S-adenosylhomocysteine nucleosidase n=1 Tax=Subtercola endophyticus TaxID=2895559 RepID=UPI001E64BEC7|nr:5'-methylthioadenosine/S-adenosylhomocysteine nucleosidase [Subtercola endophyticus]UFS61107.1 5'-methylthioadenosine/S-adenosylhomocysteine nucleosidase [Subtercola endophyticus]